MRKFVLIDQSIKNAGGHHLEYALRVLKAAKAQGMETILAVHKDCEPIHDITIDHVEYSFSHTFWENLAKYKGERLTDYSRFLSRLKEKKDALLYEIIYSKTGMIYNALRGQSTKSMIKKYVGRKEVGSISTIKIVLIQGLLVILQNLKVVASKINRLLNKSGIFGRIVKKSFLLLILLLLSPLILLYLIPKLFILTKVSLQYSDLFQAETHSLLRNCDIGSDDIVFIPTLAETELLGLLELSHHTDIAFPDCHLLFRRNLFTGREPAFASQFEDSQESRIVLNRFERDKTNGNYFFYTDTDHLTYQYNSLGAMTFLTLPIPHDETLSKDKTDINHRPLVISSIGDARTEKGFQYLPKLISDLEAKGIGEKQVHYRFQSNFNVPEGEPAPRVAKAMLSNYSKNYVELLEGPFDSKTYASIVNSSDIILIPYDKDNYYARSSGILAEALVAGIPVVVPAATWMSSAFTYEVQDYLKNEFEKASTLKSYINFPYVNVCVPSQYSTLIVELEWNQLKKGVQCHLQLQRLISSAGNENQDLWNDENVDTLVLEPLTKYMYCKIRVSQEGCYRLVASLENSLKSSNDVLSLKSFLKTATLKGLEIESPAAVIGTTYCNVDRFSDSVSELVNHYSHYLKSAQKFKQKWYSEHSAENLVQQLILNSQNGDAL